MPDDFKELSKTEWKIMNICWDNGQVTARNVYEEMIKDKKRGYQTVKTMMDRLVEKGYLRREKFGPIWLYKAVVKRSNVVSRAVDSFVNNVLDNTFTPIFTHFAKKEKLTEEEIQALKNLIEEKEEEDKK